MKNLMKLFRNLIHGMLLMLMSTPFAFTQNVGIGTTEPAGLLTLSHNTEPVLRLESTNGGLKDWETLVANGKLIFRGGADTTGVGLTDYITFSSDGFVGIGEQNPSAKLHIRNGDFLSEGIFDPVFLGPMPANGPGARLMWVPEKGAFRVGNAWSDEWDFANVGDYSFVGGGENNKAFGIRSFVGGGAINSAMGALSFVGGGQGNNASQESAFVGGGFGNMASGFDAFVGGGFKNIASGSRSFVGGGERNTAASYGETVFGLNSTLYVPNNPFSHDSLDRLFVIGNGLDSANRSNALTVFKNGNTNLAGNLRLEGASTLYINPTSANTKITLWDNGSTTDHYGFGISSGQINYHTLGTHNFYLNGKNGDGDLLMRIDGGGNVSANTFVGDGSALTGINVDDADSDPTNELITSVTVSGDSLRITDAGGTKSVFLTGGVDNDWTIAGANMNNVNSGKIGINTTDFSHQLTIKSLDTNTVRLKGPTGGLEYGAKLNFGDADYVYLKEDLDDRLTIYAEQRLALMGASNFKVGIGTIAPSWNLDVAGSSPDDGAVFQMSNSDKSQFFRIFSGRLNNPEPFFQWKTGSPLKFLTSNDDNSQLSELMRISATGNLGIGTNNPTQLLTISAPNEPVFRFDRLAGWDYEAYTTSGGKLIFRGGADATGAGLTNFVTFDSNGKVGIGTSAPDTELHIRAAGVPTARLQSNSTESAGRISMRQSNLTGADMYYDAVPDELIVEMYSGGTSLGKKLRMTLDGNMAIGTDYAAGHKLSVNGKIAATEVRVQPIADWPDYVFAPSYPLMPLEELEQSIAQNNHLPGIPSAQDVKEEGIHLGEMQTLSMEKIEELTLYLLQMNNEMKALKQQVEHLQKENEVLKGAVIKLKSN